MLKRLHNWQIRFGAPEQSIQTNLQIQNTEKPQDRSKNSADPTLYPY